MISLKSVSKIYRRGANEVSAVRNLDLDIPSGAFSVIMGPSGSGKSTLLHLIGCLDTPTEGKILLNGTDLAALSSNERAELRARRIGFVFQSFNQISNLSAAENVELPMLLSGVSRTKARERARSALERVGLDARRSHRPTELSGGELQRVAIARALINDPDVILADEPTGNLDTETGGQVTRLLRNLKSEGSTPIVVTHNPEFEEFADFLVHMRDGQRVDCLDRSRREVVS